MKTFKGYGFFVLMLLVLALVFIANEYFINSNRDNYSVTQFKQDIMEEKIQSVEVRQNAEVPTGELTAKYSNGEKRVYVSDVNQILQFLDEKNFTHVRVGDVARTPWYLEVLPYIIGVVLILLLFSMMSSNANGGGGGGKMMNFGKSRAKLTMPDDKVKTFQDVAGLVEEKEQLEEIVDFLSAPGKYTKLGARIPKGVIMVGPPGTGKTLLAKAVAGEAGVPFFSISGSDFVEMFVGVGASRVRDLFAEAKKNAPCIVFIDEIDAVARRRGSGLGGGHDEREQTLNQMLVEMDGFGINEGIIVMAATNRVDILDPAILRPGRFDRKITVGRPDVRGREEILKVHAKDKPLSDDVNLEDIARTTAGFVGADLENLLNEAAIAAARDNRVFIVEEDIKKSFIKVGIGAEKRSKVISDKDKRITAYHEAGHAILFHLLPDVGPVYTVSIIPTGQGAAGYTMPLPEKDELHLTKGKMLQDITVCLGGRIAESIAFDDVTTGAVQDIKQATEAARDMVTRYGFSEELGMINYDTSDDEVFIGRDIAHTKTFSEGTAEIIDREVKKIINSCHEKATSILKANQDILDRLAKLLIEKERITREEFELLFEQNDDETVENA
ncbi:MAG: ATP-dependent zinc metalloprotease FtsH [Eubacterium sp.]|jgi:ATP-dependent metalloprotease FtsH|nr:ATP-dependent zinc metalloprotease FtsH [Eubacterium sp.]MCI9412143.1 ATP-dependent zinc metalloprotease FtsH [Eubacterium sp.]